MFPAQSLIPIHDANPTRTFSWLTATIIGLNVLVFLITPSFGSVSQPTSAAAVADVCATTEFFYQWGMVPREITEGQSLQIEFQGCPGGTAVEDKSIYLSLLTSMFVHGGLFHIAGNMLFLWVFGNNIEDRLGRFRFIIFYLVCGVAAGLAHVLTNPASDIPTVGASGAVAGMLGAYVLLYPRARITTLLPIFFFFHLIQLPAIVVLGLWFLSQFFIGAAQQLGEAGVAWMAHVGGFLAGLLLIIPFGGLPRWMRRRRPYPYGGPY